MGIIMRDDFRLIAKIYDRIIKPKEVISWAHYICTPNTGKKLLDVGGGTGRIIESINTCFDQIFIYDVSISMLQEAKNKKIEMIGVCGEVEYLGFPSKTFDVIIMVDTLHHVEDHKKAILSILEVLKPGGVFVLEEPDIRKLPVKLIAIMEKLLLMRSHFLKSSEVLCWINPDLYKIDLFEEENNYYFVIVKKSSMEVS
jgi:demethylmenaquinone methyltransferase/2-methoxy-6-polyprenyl-1,4-benzoquinol methylase